MNLVSVIITTYDHPQWVKNAILSVINQTYSPIEIVVINDGFQNPFVETILKDFPQVKYIYQNNQGVGKARNNALQLCHGDFIQFLDDDDWLHKDAIQIKVNLLKENPHINLVYSDLYITNSDGQISRTFFTNYNRPLPSGDLYSLLINQNFIPIHASLWRKSDLERVGGFEIYSGHEDWEILINLSVYGKFMAIDKPLAFYRQHAQNMSKNFAKMYEGKLLFQDKIVYSKRFQNLAIIERKKIFTKFSVQQFAFGKKEQAKKYLIELKQIPNSFWIRFLLKSIFIIPPYFTRRFLLINFHIHQKLFL